MLFDRKNLSYEHFDYNIFKRKIVKLLRKNKVSNTFIKNTDPLYLYKKYLIFHIRNYFIYFNFDAKSYNIFIFFKIKLLINIFIYIYVLKKINHYYKYNL